MSRIGVAAGPGVASYMDASIVVFIVVLCVLNLVEKALKRGDLAPKREEGWDAAA